jgi:Putative binding domain, N-terminal
MPFRLLLVLGALAIAIAGCSRNPEATSSVMSSAPSPLTASAPGGDGAWRPAVVAFPPRADGIDFRAQLENKYRSMGRSPSEVYVDQEGDAVWIGEYYRYRVNGCDHNTAMQYVRLQIDTSVAPPICAVSFFPENAIYPPREESVDFRRQLGKKYQSMGRSSQSAVDADGIGIWMAEYFRYSSSGCDHATSTQKVLTQVDGNPAPETCLAGCAYRVHGPGSVRAAGGTFQADPERTSGSCDWLAESEVPWINLSRPVTGGNRSPLTFTVQPNPDAPRRGSIRFSYAGGQTTLDVDQGSPSYNLAFEFFDPARSATAVTECQIRSTATICTLNPVATLPTVIVNYDWRVEYAYDGSRVRTQVGPLSTMSFTEACGVLGNNVVVPISVRVIATDAAGNTATIYSGQGAQPALQLRAFACP